MCSSCVEKLARVFSETKLVAMGNVARLRCRCEEMNVDITFISLINSHKIDVTFLCLKVSVKVVLFCVSVLCVLESV